MRPVYEEWDADQSQPGKDGTMKRLQDMLAGNQSQSEEYSTDEFSPRAQEDVDERASQWNEKASARHGHEEFYRNDDDHVENAQIELHPRSRKKWSKKASSSQIRPKRSGSARRNPR